MYEISPFNSDVTHSGKWKAIVWLQQFLLHKTVGGIHTMQMRVYYCLKGKMKKLLSDASALLKCTDLQIASLTLNFVVVNVVVESRPPNLQKIWGGRT